MGIQILRNRKNQSSLHDGFVSFGAYLQELKEISNFEKTNEFMQHGATTRYLHSVAVAYYSYRLAYFLGLQLHLKELVRGALVHDYYLYNSKIGGELAKGHGKKHPLRALKNAEGEFTLTELERDIIVKHMFPFTITPPKYKESYIVSILDKACAVYEFFARRSPYPFLRSKLADETLDANQILSKADKEQIQSSIKDKEELLV